MAKQPETKKAFYLKQNKRIHIQNEALKHHKEQAGKMFSSSKQDVEVDNDGLLGKDAWQSKLQDARNSLYTSRTKSSKRAKSIFR